MKKDNFPSILIETEEVKEPVFDPETSEITKLEHFPIYNRWARKNKIPVKAPTEHFYPKYKVRFQRFDQPENVLKCRLRTSEIDWKGQLKPGNTYELPLPVIQWLNALAEPIFAEVAVNDGSGTRSETRQVGERARFSCQSMDFLKAA